MFFGKRCGQFLLKLRHTSHYILLPSSPKSRAAQTIAMRVHGALLLLISSFSPVFGFREAHVGVLDFHLPLLGAPLTDFARTAPAFHVPSLSALSSQSDSSRSKIDLVYTASAGNVLAAIHSGNGTLGLFTRSGWDPLVQRD
jgi:hypothetical protein